MLQSLPSPRSNVSTWWTRPDSNRRSPACKAGAIPLGHGPIVPTRGFEPPHPEGQQILNLSRLPVPPRRRPEKGPDGIIPPILSPLPSGRDRRHLSHSGYRVAAPDLPGATWLHRRRCDETEPTRQTSACRKPGPLALLPVARSPSRTRFHDRWWALTPPVRPLPALHWSAGGNSFCCGCSQDAALAGLPPLAVSWGDLAPPKWSWESGSSSRQPTAQSGSLPSDGSPICPIKIIPRDPAAIKYGAFRCHSAWARAGTGSNPLDSSGQMRYLGREKSGSL